MESHEVRIDVRGHDPAAVGDCVILSDKRFEFFYAEEVAAGNLVPRVPSDRATFHRVFESRNPDRLFHVLDYQLIGSARQLAPAFAGLAREVAARGHSHVWVSVGRHSPYAVGGRQAYAETALREILTAYLSHRGTWRNLARISLVYPEDLLADPYEMRSIAHAVEALEGTKTFEVLPELAGEGCAASWGVQPCEEVWNRLGGDPGTLPPRVLMLEAERSRIEVARAALAATGPGAPILDVAGSVDELRLRLAAETADVVAISLAGDLDARARRAKGERDPGSGTAAVFVLAELGIQGLGIPIVVHSSDPTYRQGMLELLGGKGFGAVALQLRSTPERSLDWARHVADLARQAAEAGRLPRADRDAGRRVGKYEIVAEIGTALDGVFYRAKDTLLGREVCLKALFDLYTSDPARFGSIVGMLRADARVRHPSYSALLDFFEAEGAYYVVQELLPEGGVKLSHLLRQGPLPLEEALALARTAVEILREVHRAGSVLVSLQAANVRRNPDGSFSLFRTVFRKPGYASPEERRGEPPTQASDFHSLGLILLDSLRGPRSAEEEAKPVEELLRSASDRVPVALAELVRDLARAEPSQRLIDPDAILARLGSVAERTRPGSEEISSKFRHYVENRFPAPIATAFGRLRSAQGLEGRALALAAVLEAWLRVTAAAAIRDRGADVPLPDALADLLAGPPTAGRLLGLVWGAWSEVEPEASYAPALRRIWGDRGFRKRVGKAIGLRNRAIHAIARTLAVVQDLQKSLLHLLQETECLSSALLLVAEGFELRPEGRVLVARVWQGRQEEPPGVGFLSGREVPTGTVYLSDGANLLPLDPFLVQASCPECGRIHLFVWSEPPWYEAIGAGHRLKRRFDSEPRAAFRMDRFASLDELPAAPRRRPAGERIGPHAIRSFIARGGMADIYEVEEHDTGQRAAMKLLSYELAAETNLLSRFRHEYAALRRVKHPNVVGVLDFGEDHGDHYIILELADGWDIEGRRVRDLSGLPRPVPWRRAVEIASAVCDGLQALHDRGLVHRDVKPSNVLLFSPDRIKIADLGIVRGREGTPLTLTGLLVGTPEYMSPEQAEGSRTVDRRSDLYSLGVLLYELVAGEPPFRASTPMSTALLHLREVPPRLEERAPGVPGALADLVARLLAKDPGERPSGCLETCQALQALLEEGRSAPA